MLKGSWKERYGDWELVTGASAGIGEEFCRQLSEKGMNIILVARRGDRLKELGEELSLNFGVSTREVPMDLILPDAAEKIDNAVADLEV